jgi:hypothetical protein
MSAKGCSSSRRIQVHWSHPGARERRGSADRHDERDVHDGRRCLAHDRVQSGRAGRERHGYGRRRRGGHPGRRGRPLPHDRPDGNRQLPGWLSEFPVDVRHDRVRRRQEHPGGSELLAATERTPVPPARVTADIRHRAGREGTGGSDPVPLSASGRWASPRQNDRGGPARRARARRTDPAGRPGGGSGDPSPRPRRRLWPSTRFSSSVPSPRPTASLIWSGSRPTT